MIVGQIFLVSVLLCSNTLCLELNRGFNVSYIENNDVITVQMDAKFLNYSLYRVELSDSSCSPEIKNIVKQANFSSQDVAPVEFHGPFERNLYCVLITPLNQLNKKECKTPCQPISQEVYIKSEGKLNCQDWQVATRYEPEGNHDGTYTLRFRMDIISPFERCFTRVIVTLWRGAYKYCSSTSGEKLKNQIQAVQVGVGLQGVAVFTNLIPGNYCARIETFHSSCDGPCPVRRAEIITLPNTTSGFLAQSSRSVNTAGTSSLIYILAVAACVIFTTIIIAVFSFYFRKIWSRFPSFKNEKVLTLSDLMELAKDKARKLEIVLLYSRDFPEHCDVVIALYHFLRKAFGIDSIRFDEVEEPYININLHSWVEDVVKPRTNRVFLIVESEGAVLQEEGRRKVKLVRPQNEDFLDDVFPYALQLLKGGTRGYCDYRTVFGMKFNYTPADLLLTSFVPNRRFTLPMHLFDLYCALLDLPSPPLDVLQNFRDQMIKEWQGPLQETLLSKIEVVSNVIISSPRMVQDSFVEQELFTCV